jgi:hypothetical protein
LIGLIKGRWNFSRPRKSQKIVYFPENDGRRQRPFSEASSTRKHAKNADFRAISQLVEISEIGFQWNQSYFLLW